MDGTKTQHKIRYMLSISVAWGFAVLRAVAEKLQHQRHATCRVTARRHRDATLHRDSFFSRVSGNHRKIHASLKVFAVSVSVAQTQPHQPGMPDHFVIERDHFFGTGHFFERYGNHVAIFDGYHDAIFATRDQLCCGNA